MRTAAKAAISISLLLLLSSLFLLPAEESSAEEFTIELLNSDGSKLDPDTPLISKFLVFTTYTDEHGTKYYLDAETVLTEKDCYLRVNATSGLFRVGASVPSASITGSLHSAGMEIRIAESIDDFKSILDTADSFSSLFKNGDQEALIRPNVMYKITILTAHGIEGESEVEKTPSFTLRFEAAPKDSYTVTFLDGDKLIENRIVPKDTALGKLPILPEKHGYDFDGWFDEEDNQVYASTIVTKSMTVHSKWTQKETHTVTFIDQGKQIETRNIVDGDPVGPLPVLPERPGYKLDGWFDEDDMPVVAKTVVTKDMVVHSRWTPVDSYTVVFSDRGKVIETRVVPKDTALGKLPDAPEREGWTFDGWFDENENKVYASTIVTSDMEVHSKWTREPTPPPGPHDKETKEEEVIIERDGTVTIITTDIIERLDGTSNI